MKRPIVINPVLDLNVPAKSSRVWNQSPSHGMHNTVPMICPNLPYFSVMGEVDESALSQTKRQNMEIFWHQQLNEMNNFTGFKNRHHLPLARVKKIIKSDPQVKMISGDTPPVFAKACEILIMEMTLRAWMKTESCNRCTIQRCDIADAIRHSENFDFLIDNVPLGSHCACHQGVDQNYVQEQAAPTADQPFFALPDMNVAIDLNQTEQTPEVSPEVMADSFVAHEPFDLNFALP